MTSYYLFSLRQGIFLLFLHNKVSYCPCSSTAQYNYSPPGHGICCSFCRARYLFRLILQEKVSYCYSISMVRHIPPHQLSQGILLLQDKSSHFNSPTTVARYLILPISNPPHPLSPYPLQRSRQGHLPEPYTLDSCMKTGNYL